MGQNAYAADILYVLTLALTKASVLLYLQSLTPVREQRVANYALGGVNGLWAFSSILVYVFRCGLPDAWDFIDGKCIDLVAFWIYFDNMNILTDLALIAMPFWILGSLQMRARRKAIILICFSARILSVVPLHLIKL